MPFLGPRQRLTAREGVRRTARRPDAEEEKTTIRMLEKTYQPAEIEPRIHDDWEKAEAFKAGRADRAGAPPYTIVIPPPNVTGSLHMGHALNNTLQDVLVPLRAHARATMCSGSPAPITPASRRRWSSSASSWRSQSRPAHDSGARSSCAASGSGRRRAARTIVNQLKRLGASCDWSRERFTMGEGEADDQMVRAVTKVFVDLYKHGLIYKDKRLVNWDPKFQTAISDLEVVQVERRARFTWESAETRRSRSMRRRSPRP